MDPMKPTRRGVPRRTAMTALLLAGLALAAPAQARPFHGPGGPGGPGDWIQRHAEELGIDEATLAQIEAIVDASRSEGEAIFAEHRAAREAMHALLEQDEPDFDAVMQQADVIGAIDVRKHKHRLATMLKVRALLTPEQRGELRALKDEMREGRGMRCPHCRHGKGECRDPGPMEGEGPPGGEEL